MSRPNAASSRVALVTVRLIREIKAFVSPMPRQSKRTVTESVAGLDPLHELLHGRDEAVRVERVRLEPEGGMAGEHQIFVDRAAMGDLLQRLLDAEAVRVGEPAGGVLLSVGPGGESALAEAAHAVRLVLADMVLLLGGGEHQRLVGRLQRLGEALRIPLPRVQQVALGHPVILLRADTDVELEAVVAERLLGEGDL